MKDSVQLGARLNIEVKTQNSDARGDRTFFYRLVLYRGYFHKRYLEIQPLRTIREKA